MLVVDKEKCNGDAACSMVCPVEAIEMVDGKAHISSIMCMECFMCMNTCTQDAIVETD